jgi:DeoR/GlpR family transcriptional regulator of sugar metabolism
MIPFSAREMTNGAEKAAIARAAVALVGPGDVIVVDGGTSTYHLAAFLGGLAVRVVTNSLRLAAALGDLQHASSQVEVHLTGGHLYPKSGLLIGPLARTGIALYHARFAFLSVGGIDARGASNTNDLVVDVERAMMDAAERVVVLADHSKIGARSMCHLAGLERVGLLITERHPASRDILARIRERGVEVNEVEVSEPGETSRSGR